MSITMRLRVPTVHTDDWWKKNARELTKLVEDYNRETWPSQRDPVTLSPWKPRKPPTGSWPLLRLTGKMQDTATFRPGQSPMTFNVKVVYYGVYQQYGTSKMVARRWLGLNEKVLQPMARVISKGLIGKPYKTYKIP